MMMMDIGMFGHGHHNQHNGVYAPTDSNYYSYSSDLSSPTHGSSHQVQPSIHYASSSSYHYDEPGYIYGPNETSETPPSPQDMNFYHQHHQNIPHDNSIINTETGLSYTNLDYSNSNSSLYTSVNHQNVYTAEGFQRTHQDVPLRHTGEEIAENQQLHGNYHQDNKYLPHQIETNVDGFHTHHLVSGTSPTSSCMEYQHLHRYKDETLQSADGTLNRLRSRHHVMHGLNAISQSQPALPTYKWMQVKRNVPKPAGKYLLYVYIPNQNHK